MKLNAIFILNFRMFYSFKSSSYLRKYHYFFGSDCFTQSSSSSSIIYNVIIVINTLITMNNQFQTLYAPRNRDILFVSFFLFTNHFSVNFSLISSQNPTFRLQNLWVYWNPSSSWFLVNNEWVSSLVMFYVLGEDKKYISRVLRMIFDFFRYVREINFSISLLEVEDYF